LIHKIFDVILQPYTLRAHWQCINST